MPVRIHSRGPQVRLPHACPSPQRLTQHKPLFLWSVRDLSPMPDTTRTRGRLCRLRRESNCRYRQRRCRRRRESWRQQHMCWADTRQGGRAELAATPPRPCIKLPRSGWGRLVIVRQDIDRSTANDAADRCSNFQPQLMRVLLDPCVCLDTRYCPHRCEPRHRPWDLPAVRGGGLARDHRLKDGIRHELQVPVEGGYAQPRHGRPLHARGHICRNR